MKNILTSIITISLLTIPVLALAQTSTAPTVDIMQALETLTNWLFTLLLVVAVLFLVSAGFILVFSSSPDKGVQAKNFLLYALIGVAVAVAARGLVVLVQTIMGV